MKFTIIEPLKHALVVQVLQESVHKVRICVPNVWGP